jgi:hypothetical protein
MTVPTILLLGIAAFYALSVLAIAVAYMLSVLDRARRRRRRRRSGMTDAEVADALATFGVDISVWPSRAPRNGSTSTHEERP